MNQYRNIKLCGEIWAGKTNFGRIASRQIAYREYSLKKKKKRKLRAESWGILIFNRWVKEEKPGKERKELPPEGMDDN